MACRGAPAPSPHMMPTASPLEELKVEGHALALDLRAKRDDLLPLSGGGNKVRKGLRILADAGEGTQAMVTTGGTQSNHARVFAILAGRSGWRCHLVLHGDPAELLQPSGNLLLMVLAGAEITIVEADEVGGQIERALSAYRAEGLNPFFVPGGGHCLAGAMAYVEAVDEFERQSDGWVPDVIVHASGTGATQAGIIAGCRRLGWPTRVIGVSVARRNPRARDVVAESLDELTDRLGIPRYVDDILVRDEWVGDGYEKANEHVLATIRRVAASEGLMLDPTYTGKAFLALSEMAGDGSIPSGSRVLFWHTGGLLNLLASNYF